MLSGKTEKLPYSLSRWTDLPASKWGWFEAQLDQGWMVGFDPRSQVPMKWSLRPEDTFGLVFWTRQPTNLLANAHRIQPYPFVIHMTLTGWEEVEQRAPGLEAGLALLRACVETFGYERVVWRFSPVPAVRDCADRFERIATVAAEVGLKEVFVSFLQPNDRVPETRSERVRGEVLRQLAVRSQGLVVRSCAEDRPAPRMGVNLMSGICESGKRFVTSPYSVDMPPAEPCGCALAVDPFTVNEACVMNCAYCYAGDRTTAAKKNGTTRNGRSLPVV